jgi:hypothetical protein
MRRKLRLSVQNHELSEGLRTEFERKASLRVVIQRNAADVPKIFTEREKQALATSYFV